MISKLSTIGMSKEEWREHRKHSIGGSDASVVLGLNPYKSKYALWAEKSGLMEPEDISEKECVRLGTDLEDYVAKRFTEKTGKKVRRLNSIVTETAYPWAHANVDRMIVGEDAGLECKTTSALNLRHFKNGEYPANYYCQCVHYMAVTGARKWYLAVLILGQDFRVFEIERDEEEIAALMDAEREFWRRVQDNDPPAVDGSDSAGEALSAVYPGGDEDEADLSDLEALFTEWTTVTETKKTLEAREDEIKQQIQTVMQNHNKGVCGDYRVSWAPQSRQSFDWKRCVADNPSIKADEYLKMTESRPFKITERKSK